MLDITKTAKAGRRAEGVYLADVASRKLVAEALEEKPLVLAGELVGGVDLQVTLPTERGLVGAAYDRRRRLLAHVALDLHLSPSLASPFRCLSSFLNPPMGCSRANDGELSRSPRKSTNLYRHPTTKTR